MTKGAAGADYPGTQSTELLTVHPVHTAMVGGSQAKGKFAADGRKLVKLFTSLTSGAAHCPVKTLRSEAAKRSGLIVRDGGRTDRLITGPDMIDGGLNGGINLHCDI